MKEEGGKVPVAHHRAKLDGIPMRGPECLTHFYFWGTGRTRWSGQVPQFAPIAQLVRAFGLYPKGHRFNSCWEYMEKRFQECNWLEKLWRYRWYLCIPFWFIKTQFERHTFTDSKFIWHLTIGEAQIKMKWYYTAEEVFERVKSKIR